MGFSRGMGGLAFANFGLREAFRLLWRVHKVLVAPWLFCVFAFVSIFASSGLLCSYLLLGRF